MKNGLHKDVESIFDGVEIPGRPEDAEHPDNAPAGPGSDAADLSSSLPSDVSDSSATIVEQTAPAPEVQESQAPPMPNVDQQQTDIEDKHDELPDHPLLSELNTIVEVPRRSIWDSLKERLFGSEQGAALKKRIIMTALMPILAIALMVILARNLKPSINKIADSVAAEAQSQLTAKAGVDWQVPDPYPTNLRDPMQFGSVSTERGSGVGSLIVKGVLYSSDKPAAIVSNKIVHVGDIISGATIVKINLNSVEFEKDGKKWTQKVRP